MRWLSRCIFVLCLLLGLPYAAAEEEIQRTVVLKVKSGGTELLTAELESLAGVELKDQSWFLKQVKSRGLAAKKILKRPEDLRYVMSGSDIVYVIYVDEGDDGPSGRIFGAGGEPLDEVDLATGAFDQAGAVAIRQMFERVLGISSDVATVEPDAEPAAALTGTAAEPEGAEKAESGIGLSVSAAGRMFKRDQTFNGANNAVLSFQSALYPGFGLVAGLSLDSVEIAGGAPGFLLGIDGGFDSLSTDEEDVSILHIDALGAVSLRFAVLELRVGARHVRYSMSSNDVFPSLVHTVAVLGLGVEQALGDVVLSGDVELHPWGIYGSKSADLFGEKSSMVGFAGHAGLGYALSRALLVRAGYRFRVVRSSFPGQGDLDFVDSRGFELVHGPELGITWRR